MSTLTDSLFNRHRPTPGPSPLLSDNYEIDEDDLAAFSPGVNGMGSLLRLSDVTNGPRPVSHASGSWQIWAAQPDTSWEQGHNADAAQLWLLPLSPSSSGSSPGSLYLPDLEAGQQRQPRMFYHDLDNPYEEVGNNYIVRIPGHSPIQGSLTVDGYIKLQFTTLGPGDKLRFHPGIIGHLPADFGFKNPVHGTDKKLWDFYVYAWCPGRTILPKTNSWLNDLVRMFDENEALRHAILALSALYLLDYSPKEEIRRFVNAYYQMAVTLLSRDMKDPNSQADSKGDDIIATLICLNMIDVVASEYRRPKGQVPRWLEGARQATKMLNASDPGHKYRRPENIQMNLTRKANIIIVARTAIIGIVLAPLDSVNTRKQFRWLLRDNNTEVHGVLGCSPKLLYMMSQITHLSALMFESPDMDTYPAGGEVLKVSIEKLRQGSELCPRGYTSTQALLDDCDLVGPDNVVDCPVKMTHLGAQAWLIAAQIYLLCRFFRLPRHHPEVRQKTGELADCIVRMPRSGRLFTAQAPFFPVFLLRFVSLELREQKIAQDWFETVIGAARCRSSVPPAYESLKRLCAWMDRKNPDHMNGVPEQIINRPAWWETAVLWLQEMEGTLCLI